MKTISLIVVLLCNFLIQSKLIAAVNPPSPVPQDTTIRILVVADTRLSNAQIDAANRFLLDSWANTKLSTTSPTSIQIASLVRKGSAVFSGNTVAQLTEVRKVVEAPVIPTTISLRDSIGADVVLAYSSNIDNSCGSTPQDNWIGLSTNFAPNANGHDLREANDDYIAIAQVNPAHVSCQYYLGAHEFGHLLGAGHFEAVLGLFSQGLLSNSRAHRFSVFGGIQVLTAVGLGPLTFDCPTNRIDLCIHKDQFSDSVFGTPDHRNADAINMTARSVANYRTGTGVPIQPATCADGISNDGDTLIDSADPDCAVCNEEVCPAVPNPPPSCSATIGPIGMVGWITQLCYPDPTGGTAYKIVWSHACPQQVSFYEVWAAQPTSSPFTLRWSVVPPYTDAVVFGSAARVKVKACGTGGCSGLSSSSFLALDRC